MSVKWKRDYVMSNAGTIPVQTWGKFTVFRMRPIQGLRWVICAEPPVWGEWNIPWADNALREDDNNILSFKTARQAKEHCESL